MAYREEGDKKKKHLKPFIKSYRDDMIKRHPDGVMAAIAASTAVISVIRIIYIIVGLYAMFLSFKINKGLSWSIIPAFLFSPIYLIYVLAVHGSKHFKLPFK